jgi:hypothetical protein
MSWIKLQTSIFEKPEVQYIAETLKVPSELVVGTLCRIWTYFDKHIGEVAKNQVENRMVEKMCYNVTIFCYNVTNKSYDVTNEDYSCNNRFLELLVEVSWLSKNEDGFWCLPHYENHNGVTAKNRAETAKRVHKHRENAQKKTDVTESRYTSVTSPLLEKRREDKRINTLDHSANVRLPDTGFESWWNSYDKKVGRPKSEKKWSTLSHEEKQKCISVVKIYVESTPDKKFRKDPLTYLNGRHWEDEILSATQTAKTEIARTPKVNGHEVYGRYE